MEADITVESHRKPGWFWADNTIIDDYGADMGPYGIALYTALARHADNKVRECYPSYNTLAKETGMSRSMAIRAAEKLVKLGLLAIEHRPPADPAHDMHQTNVFRLLPVTITVTLYSPKEGVVSVVHQGSVQSEPPVVHSVHQGGVPQTPKEDSVNKTHKELEGAAPKRRLTPVATTVPTNLIDTLFVSAPFRAWVAANLPPVQEAAIRRELLKFTTWAEANDRTYKNWQAAAYKWLLGAEWPPQRVAPALLNGHSPPRAAPAGPIGGGAVRRQAQRETARHTPTGEAS